MRSDGPHLQISNSHGVVGGLVSRFSFRELTAGGERLPASRLQTGPVVKNTGLGLQVNQGPMVLTHGHRWKSYLILLAPFGRLS